MMIIKWGGSGDGDVVFWIDELLRVLLWGFGNEICGEKEKESRQSLYIFTALCCDEAKLSVSGINTEALAGCSDKKIPQSRRLDCDA